MSEPGLTCWKFRRSGLAGLPRGERGRRHDFFMTNQLLLYRNNRGKQNK